MPVPADRGLERRQEALRCLLLLVRRGSTSASMAEAESSPCRTVRRTALPAGQMKFGNCFLLTRAVR